MSVTGGISKLTRATSSTDTSSSGNFVRKFTVQVNQTLFGMLDNDNKFFPIFFAVLEIIFMVQALLIPFLGSLQWSSEINSVAKWIFLFVHPTAVADITAFTVLFVLCGIFVGCLSFLFLYLVFSSSSEGDILNLVCALLFRITRTLLLVPMINIFFSPIMCNYFNGTFVWEHFEAEGYVSFEFPFILFYIFGIVFYVATLVICAMDILFLQDRLRNVKYYTAGSNGRFTLALLFVIELFDILEETLGGIHGAETYVSLGFSFLFLMMFIWYWRVIPFYNRAFSMIYGSLLLCMSSVYLCSGLVDLIRSPWAYMGFIGMIVPIVIALVSLALRYRIIFTLFGKKISHNLFCNGSHDITLIVVLTHKKVNEVLKIIKDPRFSKSKAICYQLAGVFISNKDQNELSVASQILKHGESIVEDRTWPDTTFFMSFYRYKVSELQYLGQSGMTKVTKLMRSLERHEKKLENYIKRVLQTVLEEERNFSKFASIFSSIQYHMSFCEKHYLHLVRVFPSERVYTRFVNFLHKFKNDRVASKTFFSDLDSDGNMTDNASHVSAESSDDPYVVKSSNKTTVQEINERNDDEANVVKVRPKDYHDTISDNVSDRNSVQSVSDGQMSIGSFTRRKGKRSMQGSSEGSEFKDLKEKIEGQAHWSKCISLSFVLFCVTLIVGLMISIFTVALVLANRFSQSTIILQHGIIVSVHVIDVAHYTRKLECSTFGNESTPLEHQRDFDFFQKTLEDTCNELLAESRELFRRSGVNKKMMKPFMKFVTLTEKKAGESEWFQNSTFYDAVVLYTEKCHEVSEYEEEFIRNTTLHDQEAYYFIIKNQPMLAHEFLDVVDLIEEIEVEETSTFQTLFFIFPTASVVMVLLVLFLYVLLAIEQKRLWKGLFLIPKEEVLEKYRQFGGDTENQTNRMNFGQTPILSKFLAYSIVVSVIFFLVGIFFAVFASITRSQFIVRNNNFHLLNTILSHARQLHFAVMDDLYTDTSLTTREEAEIQFHAEFDELTKDYFELRFGDHGVSYHFFFSSGSIKCIFFFFIQVNNFGYGMEGLYEDVCIDDIPFAMDNDTFEKRISYELSCKSLNKLIIAFLEISEEIRHLTANASEEEIAAIRGSEEWNQFIILEDFHGYQLDGAPTTGILFEKLSVFSEKVDKSIDTFLSVLRNGAIIMLLVIFPVILVLMFVLFYRFPSRLNHYMMMPKQLMMLFPKKILFQKDVFAYLMGKSGFNKTAAGISKYRMNEMTDILKTSAYAFVVFNKKFEVSYFNDAASVLFGKNDVKYFKLNEVFSKDGYRVLKDYVKKPVGLKFNQVLTACVSDYEVNVNVELIRNRDKIVAIMENVENMKKKQILEAAERRSEKTDALLRNMLPEEIAKAIKLADRYNFISQHKEVTAVFADLCDFTRWASTVDPESMVKILNKLFSLFDDLCIENKCEKIKTIGDCYFAVAGIPTYHPKHAQYAMDFARSLIDNLEIFNRENNLDLHIRVGLSTGSCVAGIIGKTKWQYDVWGTVINEAARMETLGMSDKIQVSRTTFEHLFDEMDFLERELQVQGLGVIKGYVFCNKKNEIES